MHSTWWTDEQQVAPRVNDCHPEARNIPGPLLDTAMSQWLDAQQRDMALCSHKGTALQQAQQRARQCVWEHMGWPIANGDVEAHVLSMRECTDYIHEEVEFAGAPPLRIPATVLVPRAGTAPYPAVIALHDMGGFRVYGREKLLEFEGEPEALTEHRRLCYDGISICAELARRGYLVVCIDAINFGQRTMAAGEHGDTFDEYRRSLTPEQTLELTRRIATQDEPLLVRNIMSIGRTWPGLMTVDDMRTVDYLCSRPDVDTQRIGCVGLSVGGYRTNHLAAMDSRIKAAISVCWTSTLDGVVGYNVGGAIGWFMLVPGLFEHMDICDIQALAAPRAFLAISGWQDQLMHPGGIARAHMYLRECYENAGCPEQLGSLIYDCPHEFNAQMQQDAFKWLDEKLYMAS